MTDSTERKQRPVRSYVLRQGRLTPGQRRALDELWPRFGRTVSQGLLIEDEVFGSSGTLCLEIGFGMGDSLAEQASEHPDRHFVGIEVHEPGVGHLLLQIESRDLDNVRVYSEDSVDVLKHAISDRSLSLVQIFFPDPWHKKRHHKRRLVNAEFLSLLTRRLKVGGLIHFATDWTPYAESVQSLFEARDDFEPVTAPARPETKFERRGLKLGHQIHDLAFRLTECGTPPGDLQT